MREWLAPVPGPPLALNGKNPLGESIGRALRRLPSGTAILRAPFALESEPRQLCSRTQPRRKPRSSEKDPVTLEMDCRSHRLENFRMRRTGAAARNDSRSGSDGSNEFAIVRMCASANARCASAFLSFFVCKYRSHAV